jgi:hypothetical protein
MTYDLRNTEKALPARVRKSIEDNKSMLPDTQDRRRQEPNSANR